MLLTPLIWQSKLSPSSVMSFIQPLAFDFPSSTEQCLNKAGGYLFGSIACANRARQDLTNIHQNLLHTQWKCQPVEAPAIHVATINLHCTQQSPCLVALRWASLPQPAAGATWCLPGPRHLPAPVRAPREVKGTKEKIKK